MQTQQRRLDKTGVDMKSGRLCILLLPLITALSPAALAWVSSLIKHRSPPHIPSCDAIIKLNHTSNAYNIHENTQIQSPTPPAR